MTGIRHIAAIALASLVIPGAAGRAQTSDPMVGTWTLNVAQSKTPYKSGTTVIEAAGDVVKVTADLEAADGTKYHWTWSAKYDGKDSPVTGTTPFGSPAVASLTRVDARTAKVVGKVGGKQVLEQTITVAPDGRTRTVVTHGTDASGRKVDTTALYDRK
jgi:hypothetical protein